MAYIGNTSLTPNIQPATDFFSGNGVTTSFTLSRTVISTFTIDAVINNVQQNPSNAYTVSGNVITFTSAPPSGTNNIYVTYNSIQGQVVGIGQGTVGPSQLNTGAPVWDVNGNLTVSGSVGTSVTGAIQLPAGTTALRPVSSVEGMVRKNTTTGVVEYYDPAGVVWRNVGLSPQVYQFAGTITFTPCGATGRMGPTLAQARSTYTSQPFQSNWLNNLNLFWVEQGVQYWVVPRDGTYTITATGAGNTLTYAGTGVSIQASFQLFAGERLRIVVGQSGIIYSTKPTLNVGGAGASCISVMRNNCEQLLICAGGGAGRSENTIASAQTARNATYTNTGVPEGGYGSTWELAYNPSSGIQNYWGAGGGGGWATSGVIGGIGAATAKKPNAGAALSFVAPLGGFSEAGIHGGFGGGGATGRDGGSCGGGGGYNGGHAEAYENNTNNSYATGGGSYVGLGATQINVLNTNTGAGTVTVTL